MNVLFFIHMYMEGVKMLYSDMQTNRKVKTKVPITSGMNTTIGLVLPKPHQVDQTNMRNAIETK